MGAAASKRRPATRAPDRIREVAPRGPNPSVGGFGLLPEFVPSLPGRCAVAAAASVSRAVHTVVGVFLRFGSGISRSTRGAFRSRRSLSPLLLEFLLALFQRLEPCLRRSCIAVLRNDDVPIENRRLGLAAIARRNLIRVGRKVQVSLLIRPTEDLAGARIGSEYARCARKGRDETTGAIEQFRKHGELFVVRPDQLERRRPRTSGPDGSEQPR
jgi:hypothetical protein